MTLGSILSLVSRLVRSSGSHNTLDTQTVEVFFQKSPSWPDGDDRGIEGLDYQVLNAGTVVQTGRTEADGKVEVQLSGGTAEVQLMVGDAVVATYEVTVRADPFEAATTVIGVQRRLRVLGYHLGHDGDDQDGVDGTLGLRTDRAILDFQIDNELTIDGAVGSGTRDELNDVVGGSAQS